MRELAIDSAIVGEFANLHYVKSLSAANSALGVRCKTATAPDGIGSATDRILDVITLLHYCPAIS